MEISPYYLSPIELLYECMYFRIKTHFPKTQKVNLVAQRWKENEKNPRDRYLLPADRLTFKLEIPAIRQRIHEIRQMQNEEPEKRNQIAILSRIYAATWALYRWEQNIVENESDCFILLEMGLQNLMNTYRDQAKRFTTAFNRLYRKIASGNNRRIHLRNWEGYYLRHPGKKRCNNNCLSTHSYFNKIP